MPTLSVVIPVYNEISYLAKVVDRVLSVHLPGLEKELILVEDCSTDGTRELLASMAGDNVRVFFQERNQGKGAALRRGS